MRCSWSTSTNCMLVRSTRKASAHGVGSFRATSGSFFTALASAMMWPRMGASVTACDVLRRSRPRCPAGRAARRDRCRAAARGRPRAPGCGPGAGLTADSLTSAGSATDDRHDGVRAVVGGLEVLDPVLRRPRRSAWATSRAMTGFSSVTRQREVDGVRRDRRLDAVLEHVGVDRAAQCVGHLARPCWSSRRSRRRRPSAGRRTDRPVRPSRRPGTGSRRRAWRSRRTSGC